MPAIGLLPQDGVTILLSAILFNGPSRGPVLIRSAEAPSHSDLSMFRRYNLVDAEEAAQVGYKLASYLKIN